MLCGIGSVGLYGMPICTITMLSRSYVDVHYVEVMLVSYPQITLSYSINIYKVTLCWQVLDLELTLTYNVNLKVMLSFILYTFC